MPIPNKAKGKTFNKHPTLTDQSGAKDADLNVIVERMIRTGTTNVPREQPMYGDFSQLPGDYRAFIHHARDLERLRGELPPELAAMTVEDLVAMTPEAIVSYLQPKEPPKEAKETEK